LDEHPAITVGIYQGGWPPFEEWNGGAPRGLALDYLNEATARLGVELRFRSFDSWGPLLQAACDGDIDLIMNVSITAERTECLIFTQQYAQTLVAVVARLDDPRPVESTHLGGLHIVTERDFATADAARSRYPNGIHQHVDDTLAALHAVSDDTADVYVGNAYVATHLIQSEDLPWIGLIRTSDLSSGSLHFGVPNKNRPLASALNTAMQAIPDARRNSIELRWLPELHWTSEAGALLNAAEQVALKNTLNFASPPQLAPLFFLDDNDQPMGLLAEYLGRFEELGARFAIAPQSSWRDARAAMRNQQANASITVIDPSRPLPGWTYSQPIASIPNVIVIRSDTRESIIALRDLSQQTIAVSDPERLIPLISAFVSGARFVEADDTQQGMELVRQRKADAYIGNLAVVDALVRDRFAGSLRVSAPVDIEDRFVFAAREPYADAVTAFNRMLASIPQREREAMRGDWLSFEYYNEVDWARMLRWIIPILAILISILILQAWSNRRLRREMDARKALESRFAEVTSHLPAVIYQTTRSVAGEYGFPYVAGDLKALFGIANSEAMASAESLLSRVHHEDKPRLFEAIRQSMEQVTPLDIEFRALSDRGWRWVRSASKPYSHDGGHGYWTGYWIDVTDQYNQRRDLLAAKSAAEEATRAKANFLATMSHEIRTPMSGVIGMLEMLSYTPLDQEQRKIVGTIDESAQMLKQILDDILDFSKMEAGALTLESSPLSLRSIVDGVARMLAPLSSSKGLHVDSQFDFRIAEFHLGDDVRLRQVLFNLVSNAIKFTEAGHVDLQLTLHKATERDQTIRLSVTDTGIGISDERQANLFKPFAQADASTTRRYGGTGLGLSICQRIVSQMGGSISLQSALGQGTTVLVELTLPISESEAEAQQERGRHAVLRENIGGTLGRILIAEDHPTNRVLMAWYMQQLSLDFDMVENGQEALGALDSGRYDLLITDCLMPLMSGYELASEVRRRERELGTRRLPILAITANVYRGEIDRCRAAGMDAYLAKPVSLDAIAVALGKLRDGGPSDSRAEAGIENFSDDISDVLSEVARRYGSQATARIMLESLVDTTRVDIDQLVELADNDLKGKATLLHRIAGALSTIGRSSLAARAQQLERSFSSASPAGQDELEGFVGQLEALLRSIAADINPAKKS